MVNAIAIMHTWPEVRNAEYEVLQRLLAAAQQVGQAVAVINNDGIVLWASASLQLIVGSELPRDAVRYVISLHFESPRVLDIYSYYALWQPIEFYYDFGYERSLDKFGSHNDLLSCDSDLADAHALNLYTGFGREPLEPLVRMFHSPAAPYYEPNIREDAKLFYIGINWERIGRPKGRFHDTLVSLDQQNLTSIYGPEKILGVAPWEGFRTYQGELPFDGRSVMRAINRAGICLALSSAQHRATGIMSNRLFEGFAGGAAVIATPNSIIDKHFRDCVYLVDDSRGEEALGQMIVEAVREIRSDREEAMRRSREGQRILGEICSLEGSLKAISENHDARVAHFEKKFLADASEATVVLVDNYGSAALLRARLGDYASQRHCTIDLHVVCDEVVANQLASVPGPGGAVRNFTVHGTNFVPRASQFDGIKQIPKRSGPIVHAILSGAKTPFFMVTNVSDMLFGDHLASLARALDDQPTASFAVSGIVIQTRDAGGEVRRSLGAARFAELDTLLLGSGSQQRGRFLFRTSLVKPEWAPLMSLLDGEEVSFYQLYATLEGQLAQTGYASMVSDETIVSAPRRAAEGPAIQHQYIRDRFSRDSRWLDRLSCNAKLPAFVHAYAPGAPVRWRDFTLSASSRAELPLNQLLPVRAGGAGLDHIGAGFSVPEPDHVWLASDRGIIEFELSPVDPTEALHCEIVLLVAGRRSRAGREQHCTVILNGSQIAYLAVPDHVHEMRVAVPLFLLQAGSAFRLELIPDHFETAQVGPDAVDDRRLSISLMGLGVFSERQSQIQTFELGQIYSCGTGEAGAAALTRGFYAPEPDLCWIAGLNGQMNFAVSGTVRRPALLMDIRTRSSHTGANQQITLAINGNRLASLSLPDGRQRLVIPFREFDLLEYVKLDVAIGHAEVTRDGDQRIIDGRLLGCAIFALGVVDADSFRELVERTEACSASAEDVA